MLYIGKRLKGLNQITGNNGFWAIKGLVMIKVGDVVQRILNGAIAHLSICGGFERKH